MSNDWMKLVRNQGVEALVEIAKEVEVGDPFDWSDLSIDEDEAYRLMASHVLEMEDNSMLLAATVTKLLVENMVLNMRLLENGQTKD
jgi:hypothetical protein